MFWLQVYFAALCVRTRCVSETYYLHRRLTSEDIVTLSVGVTLSRRVCVESRRRYCTLLRVHLVSCCRPISQGPDYKKILRLSYDVIITYDNRKSNLR